MNATSKLVRAGVLGCSSLNMACGALLLAGFVFHNGGHVPKVVLGIALALMGQSLYSLLLVFWERAADSRFRAGLVIVQGLAGAVGLFGGVNGFLYNMSQWQSPNPDMEPAPMLAGAFMFALAVLTLWHMHRERREVSKSLLA